MKVLLIENDLVTALAVAARFADEAIEVDHAENLVSGLSMGRAGGYDAMVVDRGLPDGDGIDVVRQLRSEGNATPVAMLSAWTSTEARVEALRSGADAYLNKPFDVAEVVEQVAALTRRRAAAEASHILSVGDL